MNKSTIVCKSIGNKPLTCEHYATKRIIEQIDNNDNYDCYLSNGPIDSYNGSNEPHELNQKFADKLDRIFKSGADIVLETKQGYADDGGDCYQAYILLPEYQKEFNEYFEENYEKDGKCYFQLCIMEYLLSKPEQLRVVWAGPY